MELFDVIKKIFNKKDWETVGKNDKVKNFFMINRIMAIQWPIQANQFNHTKVTPSPVVDWWHGTMSGYYSRTPNWIFTKTKRSDKKELKKIDFSEYIETENFIRSRFEISKREILDLKKFYPEKYEEWIKGISEQLKSINKEN
jgi:hypothetical protein